MTTRTWQSSVIGLFIFNGSDWVREISRYVWPETIREWKWREWSRRSGMLLLKRLNLISKCRIFFLNNEKSCKEKAFCKFIDWLWEVVNFLNALGLSPTTWITNCVVQARHCCNFAVKIAYGGPSSLFDEFGNWSYSHHKWRRFSRF